MFLVFQRLSLFCGQAIFAFQRFTVSRAIDGRRVSTQEVLVRSTCTALLATLLVAPASLSHCLPTQRRVPPQVTRTEQSESAVRYGLTITLRPYLVIIVIQPMGLNVIVNIY